VVTGSFSGNVIAERYIKRNENSDGTGRAWRLVSVPVGGGGNLRDFFMNGRLGQDLTLSASRDDESENSGTPIVGHNYVTASEATTAGFDWIGVPYQVSSLRYYSGDASGGTFNSEQVPSLLTSYASADQGYMVFTRGDRKLDFPSTTNSGSTTFRSTGALKTGNQTVLVQPAATSKYTLVGNPYMSVLDLDAFYTTNSAVINPSFGIWDANIAGTNKQGGYVNVYKSGGQWVTNTGTYIDPELLESGMAFFVEPLSTLGTATNITIMESHKSSAAAAGMAPFATDEPDDHGRMYIRLERADATGKRNLIDGVMADFHTSYRETLGDVADIGKMRSAISNGSLWLTQSNKNLSSEGRPWPAVDTRRTLPLRMGSIGDQTLLLTIDPRQFTKPGLKAWLRDNALNRETELDLTRINEYDFIGTGIASKDTTRFEIVYAQTLLPGVKFLKAEARKSGDRVDITWEVSQDAGARYTVERSGDRETFRSVQTLSSDPSKAGRYGWTDAQPLKGVGYYRILSTNATGQTMYSGVMRVNMSAADGSWKLYPNPAKAGEAKLQLEQVPAGSYRVLVLDQTGRQVAETRVEHQGGSAEHVLLLSQRLAAGSYILQVMQGDLRVTMMRMVQE
jgi:hypothetical protein